MAAFEGLRLIRLEITKHPNLLVDDLLEIICKVEPDANSLDFEAATHLNKIVAKTMPTSGIEFYRHCIHAVLITEFPSWAKLMTLGRKRFIQKLSGEEYRDITSLFRQAGLLIEPPTILDIAWWDDIAGRVRLEVDREKLQRARDAEQLTLEIENNRLRLQGIDATAQWTAIEDNTAGYDVLSYSKGEFGLINKLIEVKSTIASPMRFQLTRNEWDHAIEVGNAYHFHIWNMQSSPPFLYEKSCSDIAPHIPQDNKKGKWKIVEIPVGL